MSANNQHPSPFQNLQEHQKTAREVLLRVMFNGCVSSNTPKGQQQPVLCIPGFLAPEFTMKPLNNFLKAQNYVPYNWGHGVNWGPKSISIKSVAEKVLEISDKHHGQPVHIIGQSLGGVYALGLAGYLEPLSSVGRVITMGSPINTKVLSTEREGINRTMNRLFNYLNQSEDENVAAFMQDMEATLRSGLRNTPITCIYSQSDSIIGGDMAQTNLNDALKENIEVRHARHTGMASNPFIRLIIADRLALDAGDLQEFDIDTYVPSLKYFCPKPEKM